MFAMEAQFLNFIKKLETNGDKLPSNVPLEPPLDFEFNNSTCYVCNGYYGPSFGEPVCGTCHAFLFPDFPSYLPSSYFYSEKTDDGDSGNDEPSDLNYISERKMNRACTLPSWWYYQNSLDSETSPEDEASRASNSAAGASSSGNGGGEVPLGCGNRADGSSAAAGESGGIAGGIGSLPGGSGGVAGGMGRGAGASCVVAGGSDGAGEGISGAAGGSSGASEGSGGVTRGNGEVSVKNGGAVGVNRGAAGGSDGAAGGSGDAAEGKGGVAGGSGGVAGWSGGAARWSGGAAGWCGGSAGGSGGAAGVGDGAAGWSGGSAGGSGGAAGVGDGAAGWSGGSAGGSGGAARVGHGAPGGSDCADRVSGGAAGGSCESEAGAGDPEAAGGGSPAGHSPPPPPSDIALSLRALSTPRLPDNLAPGLVERLPSEVLLCIFNYLDDLSLCSCACVCARWRLLVRARVSPPRWAEFTARRFPLYRPLVGQYDWHKKYQALVESCFCRNCLVQMCVQAQPDGEENAWRRNRLRIELKMLRNDPPEGIAATPLDAKCCHWQASVTGPVGSPYEGGIFYLYIQVPYAYPMSPPVVRFLTRILHPNISRHGDVGIDSVHHNWSLALTISKVLISIQSLLTDPYTSVCMEPELGEMYARDRQRFETLARNWTWRYAMHDILPH